MFHVYLCYAVFSVPCSLVITFLKRADLLALLCGVFSCVFVSFPYGVLGIFFIFVFHFTLAYYNPCCNLNTIVITVLNMNTYKQKSERGIRVTSSKTNFKNTLPCHLNTRSYPCFETIVVIYTRNIVLIMNTLD